MARRPLNSKIGRLPASWPGSGRVVAIAGGAMLVPAVALAQDDSGLRLMTARLDSMRFDLSGPLGLLMIGLAIFAATIAILHVRARRLWNEQFEAQRATVADLQSRADRAALFMGAEPQFFVSWDGPAGTPEHDGDPTVVGEGMTSARALNFNEWLPLHEKQRLDAAVIELRASGQRFNLQLNGLGGALIEANGQAVAGRVVMRLRSVSGERLEVVRLADRLARVTTTMDALKAMLDDIPQPVWLRNRSGKLAWVNAAYVRAVEGTSAEDVIERSADLLESQTLQEISAARSRGEAWRGKAQVVVAGDRRVMDVVDVASPGGSSGGLAVDVTALDLMRRDFEEQSAAHVRTLDQMPTAIALFDASQRLVFYNRAFNMLWQLDPRFLKSGPTHMVLLDRLRDDGKLPEQTDFRAWKQGLQQSFQSNEPLEDIWLLPGGRSLRVVTSPSTAGSVTYMFSDITEQMHLAQDYNRLAEMQGETLDALTEGVALFGSNGRLRLRNPAFASLWELDGAQLSADMHIDEVTRLCPPETHAIWADLKSAVCGLGEARVNKTHELRTRAGKVLQLSLTPLPEGASLLTIEDVTSTVTAAKMLSERNQALESAAAFKSEFIHNVSFELRLPLTSVVGIAQLLATGTAGPLNERQRGYATDLMRATDAVLALINDILDLASIDSSGLDLKVGRVDLYKSIEEASTGLKDRLGGAGVNMRLRIAQNVGGVLGDERRIRQILFNLLANAVACSDPGDTVLLTADRSNDRIIIRTIDRGSTALTGDPGLGVDAKRRMERGQNIRLSIVQSLVELHHGQLLVEGRPDGMRQVVCILPAAAPDLQKAAS
ncbi:MAG: PAS-domain containing protein [Proteobacteria bacterium]|nr:PAS-domain containing protein [Pseudomonadota bacterium]